MLSHAPTAMVEPSAIGMFDSFQILWKTRFHGFQLIGFDVHPMPCRKVSFIASQRMEHSKGLMIYQHTCFFGEGWGLGGDSDTLLFRAEVDIACHVVPAKVLQSHIEPMCCQVGNGKMTFAFLIT
jgi:hypothetical protein